MVRRRRDPVFHVQDCDLANYTSPVITYSHEEGCSITGGYVYRGAAIPELTGTYFYSDWCSEWIRSFKYVGGQVTEERDWTEDLGTLGQVNTFGVDSAGRLALPGHPRRPCRPVRGRPLAHLGKLYHLTREDEVRIAGDERGLFASMTTRQ